MKTERIQKILAQAGITSRRKAEELIESGSVTVNGKVAKLGDKADASKDHIKVNGKLITGVEPHLYVLFYKPKGVISNMSDPEGRASLRSFFSKISLRLFPVSSLDFNSEGLLLLTNDGAITESIQKNPKFPRIYNVKLKGYLTSEMLSRLERGGKFEEKMIKTLSVRIIEELNKKTMIELVLLGEANADLKGFIESRGFLVDKISRVGFGHLTLKGLQPGGFRILKKSQVEALVAQPELGVKELEKRIEKERSILPIDLKEDGKMKLAMTLSSMEKKKMAKKIGEKITKVEQNVITSLKTLKSAVSSEKNHVTGAPKETHERKPFRDSKPKYSKEGFSVESKSRDSKATRFKSKDSKSSGAPFRDASGKSSQSRNKPYGKKPGARAGFGKGRK